MSFLRLKLVGFRFYNSQVTYDQYVVKQMRIENEWFRAESSKAVPSTNYENSKLHFV